MKKLNIIKLLFLVIVFTITGINSLTAQCNASFTGDRYEIVGAWASFSQSPPYTYYDYFVWDFGDGNQQVGTSGTHTSHVYNTPGTYDVCLIKVDTTVNNCTDTFCSSIKIDMVRACSSSFTATDNGGLNYSFTSTATGVAPFTYLWYFPNNQSTLVNPSYTFASSNYMDVYLYVTDSIGCVSTFWDTLSINTGVEISRSVFNVDKIYPNPFKEVVNIEFNLITKIQVDIFITDLLGNIINVLNVHEMQMGKNKIRWDAGDLSNGIYFMNIKTDESLQVEKLILNR